MTGRASRLLMLCTVCLVALGCTAPPVEMSQHTDVHSIETAPTRLGGRYPGWTPPVMGMGHSPAIQLVSEEVPAEPANPPLVPDVPWEQPRDGGVPNGPPQLPGTAPQGLRVPRIALSLRGAIAQALQTSDVVRIIDGGTVGLAAGSVYDAETAAARTRTAEAVFDPRVELSYIGSKIDQPPDAFFGPGISTTTRRDEGDFIASLSKSWQTGATTRLAFEPPLGYLYLPGTNDPDSFNPAYTSAFVFEAKQPLLRGAGKDRNLAPIRIAQIRTDQATWQLRQSMLAQVRSIEESYWDLQAAAINLQSVELLIPLAEEIVRIQENRYQNEIVIGSDVARAQTQLQEFRQRYTRFLAALRTREYRLRNLLSLPLADGALLTPIDAPRQERVAIDVQASMQAALQNQPEVIRQQLDVALRENELTIASNDVRPQLDLRALYRLNGLSDRLDTSLDMAFERSYTDWTLGATFAVPLGNRAAKASRAAAELQLTRERVVLQKLEENFQFRIAGLICEIESVWDQYELTQRRLRETQEWVRISRVRFTYPPPAESSRQDVLTVVLVDYQQALQAHLDAVSESSTLLAQYNSLLARLQETEGTLLDERLVEINQSENNPSGTNPPQPLAPTPSEPRP